MAENVPREYRLSSVRGIQAVVSNYGAALVSLWLPDRAGRLADVTVGPHGIAGRLQDQSYMGATVGRYGNRIASGRFRLDGVRYQLARNDGPNHLHGGERGFDKRVWHGEAVSQPDAGVRFTYLSADGEEGYPGTLRAQATYWICDDELRIDYAAVTDKPTIVNLVQHTYWNLTGDFAGCSILDHELTLDADAYLPVDAALIPLAAPPLPGAATPFDFTRATRIGARIDLADEQLAHGGGYDHAWVLRGAPGRLRRAARLADPLSGRVMELFTDQPAIQFYSGNFLTGLPGREGRPMARRHALCLETEAFPDSPNRADFPSCVLLPGAQYRHRIVYRFSTDG